jgi:hypothetical protein
MLTLSGTLIAVTFTAWLGTRSVHAMIGELRAEVRAHIASLQGELKLDVATLRTELTCARGELKLDMLRIENKLDHYAEVQASHSEKLENRG